MAAELFEIGRHNFSEGIATLYSCNYFVCKSSIIFTLRLDHTSLASAEAVPRAGSVVVATAVHGSWFPSGVFDTANCALSALAVFCDRLLTAPQPGGAQHGWRDACAFERIDCVVSELGK